jgi:hypothetical protein
LFAGSFLDSKYNTQLDILNIELRPDAQNLLHRARQVAVAVLLDNFIQASAQIEDEEKVGALSQQREMARVPHPLDPVMERLSQDYIDDEDLSRRIRDLFEVGRPAAVGPGPAREGSREAGYFGE